MQSNTLCIISATARSQETKGITGCIFGKSGTGKRSLPWRLPYYKTLFVDLEAPNIPTQICLELLVVKSLKAMKKCEEANHEVNQ